MPFHLYPNRTLESSSQTRSIHILKTQTHLNPYVHLTMSWFKPIRLIRVNLKVKSKILKDKKHDFSLRGQSKKKKKNHDLRIKLTYCSWLSHKLKIK